MSWLQEFTGSGVGGSILGDFHAGYQIWEMVRANFAEIDNRIKIGNGSPQGIVVADIGALYIQLDGTTGTTLWGKVSGNGTNLNWVSFAAGAAPTLSAAVLLTDAQVKALPTTPVQIIAPPATGARIKVIAASINNRTTLGAYTNLNSTFNAFGLQWGNFAGFSGHWAVNPAVRDTSAWGDGRTNPDNMAFLSTAGRFSFDFGAPYPTAVGTGASAGDGEWVYTDVNNNADCENLGLYLAMDNNGSGNLTGGNADNLMRVYVYYAIEFLL